MKKKAFLIIILLSFNIAIILQAKQGGQAEQGEVKQLFHFGGKVGWVNHSESLNGESDSDGGLGFGAWFTYPLSSSLKVREQIGRSSFSSKETVYDYYGYKLGTLTGTLSDFSWISYLIFSFPLRQTGANSYLGAGLGLHIMGMTLTAEDIYGNSETQTESSTNLGFDFIGGTSFPVGNIQLLFEIGFNIVDVPDSWWDTYNEFSIMGGIEF